MNVKSVLNQILSIELTRSEASMLASGLSWSVSVTAPEGEITKIDIMKALEDMKNCQPVRHVAEAGTAENAAKQLWLVSRTTRDTFIIEATRDNWKVVACLLNSLINGFSIDEWELHSLLGYHRSELRTVFNDLHWILVTPDRDLDELAKISSHNISECRRKRWQFSYNTNQWITSTKSM